MLNTFFPKTLVFISIKYLTNKQTKNQPHERPHKSRKQKNFKTACYEELLTG